MRVWTNTGIRGVIVGPFDKPSKLAKGKWERWVSVAFGYSVESPDFNRVVLDHFHNMLMHLGILRQRGYKRIGLLLYGTHETQVPGLLMGAYLLEQARTGARRIAARIREELNTPRKMKAWILKERLDALIAPIEEYRILRRTGLRIPDDIGFSLLSWKAYDPLNPGECSGVNANPEHVAMDTVSFLVSQLHEHAFGLSERPKCLLVPGTFQDGSTIRPPA
jgi:LacI family transcriptional regulator